MTQSASSIALIRNRLRYDPETGKLFRTKNGSEAFTAKHSNGYLRGWINNRNQPAHRVIWALVYGYWPEGHIDHINGCKSDNRLANLREATCSQNQMNVARKSTNTSGFKGVSWASASGKWRSQIRKSRTIHHLGYFEDPAEAHAAYCAAAKRLHGDFARIR